MASALDPGVQGGQLYFGDLTPKGVTFLPALTVNVHPAAVLLFIFVGGALFGVLGMVLALPLAAVFNAYWSRYGPHNGGSQGNPPLTF